jgi:uncharacterized protein YaaW (UPF0174 family)
MKSVLEKCHKADFEYLSDVLDSYVSFTNDSKRKELLNLFDNPRAKSELVTLVDQQIRYYGSADLAYLKRIIASDGDGGVSAEEVIEDVCAKLKVSLKHGGSNELRLEKMVNAVVEKELLSKTPEELSAAFKKIGVGNADHDLIMEHLKSNGKAAVLPILLEVLGPKVAMGIVETIIVALIAKFIGQKAAQQLVKELIKRNPWVNVLGPVIWVLSSLWLAYDLQGPAYRKTVPICLYLGIVALRDGEATS